jgi:alanine racemase
MIELEDLLMATEGQLHGKAHARQFTDLAFDSRRLFELEHTVQRSGGPLFVAVKSDTGDGHDYIIQATHRGATGILCERVPAGMATNVTCVIVDNTRQALLDWARFILQKHGTHVIAVTGSTGKTVTKEAIAAVLSTRFSVFRNYGTYSGRYGLPIALGKLTPLHRIAVLELAADSINEISDLARLTQPSIGVVTTVNEAHIDVFGSLEAIEREKGELIGALPSEGIAVLNRDDPRVWRMRTRTGARIVSYGLASGADYVAQGIQCTESGLRFRIRYRADGKDRIDLFTLNLYGRHHVYAALAAVAVGRAFGIPISDCTSALRAFYPIAGRLNAIAGQDGTTLLDDSYDAELACTLAALDALADHFSAHRRIAVLGSLRSQAGSSDAYHQIGTRAAQVADLMVLKGECTQPIRQAALSAGMDRSQIYETFTNVGAIRHLTQAIRPGDTILIKGARQERLEEITRGLLIDPDRASPMLVRQEEVFRHVQLSLPQRPTWLEVDLEAIVHNLRLVRSLVGDDVAVMAVLKADGYGHGAERVARTVVNNGAHMLGVACLSEGVRLRRVGIEAPILVLGFTPAWQAREAVLNDITLAIFDIETTLAFDRVAGQIGRTIRVHLKVDSGMGRLGLLPDEALPLLQQAVGLPNLLVEGIFTHFSVADDADKSYTYAQLAQFQSVLGQIEEAGIRIPLVHASNSAAILSVPEARFNMVRLGIALYGLAPSQETPLPRGFRTALSFKTRVAQVKTLPPGSFVSYGNTYQTQSYEQIAIIPVGYADGFRRAPSHWGEVLVRGQRAPIVGRVCMDQTMINVSHIPDVRQGDEVVLIGRQGADAITVDSVAERLGTINYEVISEILARVPRVS